MSRQDLQICASLPSSTCAYKLVQGDLTSLPAVFGSTLGRAGLISLGMLAFGERDTKTLVKYSLGGALAIEGFVLAYALYMVRKAR